MNLDLERITQKIQQNDFIKNFMEELSQALENFNNKNEIKGEEINQIELTPEQDLEFYRKRHSFLQEYFKDELTDLSDGEIFLVTDQYENDYEYHRYKVAQYINDHERKYIAFEKDLPENVRLGDVVRKVNGKYIYDEQATRYVNECLNKIKQDIVS